MEGMPSQSAISGEAGDLTDSIIWATEVKEGRTYEDGSKVHSAQTGSRWCLDSSLRTAGSFV
jgi:hypothetical protein